MMLAGRPWECEEKTTSSNRLVDVENSSSSESIRRSLGCRCRSMVWGMLFVYMHNECTNYHVNIVNGHSRVIYFSNMDFYPNAYIFLANTNYF